MRKMLCVISDLEYGSVAAQCVNLLRALDPDQYERRVCVLGRSGPWAEKLRQAGIAVDAPGRGRLFDLTPLVTLRRLMSGYAPDVVHAWGRSAMRLVALSGFKGRLVASPCLRPDFQRSWLRRLDGWLLGRAAHVVVFGDVEAERCRMLGYSGKLVVVHPAVALDEAKPSARRDQFVLCIGRLEAPRGFSDAVWALDILHYVHPRLHLVIVGAGLDRDLIERYVTGMEMTERVELVGEQPEVVSLLKAAEVVWSPGRVETGTQVVLEAMAAARPVIASRHPRLAELIVDGETGFLVPAEDKAALAKQTHLLLSDLELRARMGEAGRRRVAEQFTPKALAEAVARVYKE